MLKDFHRLKSTNNAPQKVIVKLSKQKDVYQLLNARPSLKNVDLNGTGIPPSTRILVNLSLCIYYKFLWSKCKKLGLNKVVESFWVSKGSCRVRLLEKSVNVITYIDNLKILFHRNPVLEYPISSF